MIREDGNSQQDEDRRQFADEVAGSSHREGVGLNGSRVELAWIQGNVCARTSRRGTTHHAGGDETSPPSLCGLVSQLLHFSAIEQGDQLLASGGGLNPAAHDFPRADRLVVKPLVSVTVRAKRGAVE